MNKKKYKAALIGCGKIGAEIGNYSKNVQPATHAAAHQGHPLVSLVALVDTDRKRLKVVQGYFPGIPVFDSASEMFKKIKPDIVSIATQADSHCQLVKLAAKARTKAIICEKPISTSLKEAKEMIKTCRRNKSLLFINHPRRFDPLLKKWQRKINQGILGNLLQGSCYYYNGLFNSGTHIIDFLRFLIGKSPFTR